MKLGRPGWLGGGTGALAAAWLLYTGLMLVIHFAHPAGLAGGLLGLAHTAVAAPLLLLTLGRVVWLNGRRAGARDAARRDPPDL